MLTCEYLILKKNDVDIKAKGSPKKWKKEFF